MKTSIALLLLFVTIAGAETPQAAKSPSFVMTGNSFRQEGVVNHARGNVVVKTDALEILADEVDFNAATGELEARGHVIVTAATPQPAAASGVKNTPERTGLTQDLDAAKAMVARETELFSKGLASKTEVERAETELKRLQGEAAKELSDKGLSPRAEMLRTPLPPEKGNDKAAAGWTIQTDALKLKLPVGR